MNTNRASASTKLMSDAGGLSSSWIAPLDSVYCTGSTDSQLDDQDEHEQRDRQRQHERRDLHADRGLDLVAHLDGDALPRTTAHRRARRSR